MKEAIIGVMLLGGLVWFTRPAPQSPEELAKVVAFRVESEKCSAYADLFPDLDTSVKAYLRCVNPHVK